MDPTNGKITITWDKVEPYNYSRDDGDDNGAKNSLQVVLTDLGGGDFGVEYIYDKIMDARVGGDNAIAGLTDGDGTVFELEGAGDDGFMEDNYRANDFGYGDPRGTFSFNVVNATPDALNGLPCYAPGTLIETPDGPRAVETLTVGDLVNTLDHGPQPIRWIRSARIPCKRPVLVKSRLSSVPMRWGKGCRHAP